MVPCDCPKLGTSTQWIGCDTENAKVLEYDNYLPLGNKNDDYLPF